MYIYFVSLLVPQIVCWLDTLQMQKCIEPAV